MRDIGNRIRRYRLARYATPDDPIRRKLRWAWVFVASWLAWVGLISDHSFLQLWRLGRENAKAQVELEQVRRATREIEARVRDPKAIRSLAEHELREKSGMARPTEIIYRIQPATGDSASRD